MDKIIYRLVYNRQKCLNERGTALVQVEALLHGRRKYFSTNIYLLPRQWSKTKSMVIRHPHAEELNQMLHEMMMELEAIELALWKKGRQITLEILKESFNRQGNEDSFVEFFREEVAHSPLRQSTRKNHLSTLALLQSFSKGLTFSELSYEFLTSFEDFLLGKGFHVNTVAKHMKHLKKYVNIAINKDLLDFSQYAFRKYKIKTVEYRHSFLTPEELLAIESLDYHGRCKKLLMVRDAFLFCCYTGLRYSDFISLKEESFVESGNEKWLCYRSVKTGTEVRLPMKHLFGGKALHLINIYKDNLKRFFDLGSNSNVNKMLLKIARMAHVEKHVSFHTARHTNASLLIYKGVNITTVQKLLGHRSVKTTQLYAHVMDQTIVNDLIKTAR